MLSKYWPRPAIDYRRWLIGTAVAIPSIAAAAAVMFPFRSHLSTATVALVLVVPVVTGGVTGGFPSGAVAAAAGFLAYDYLFIPPYYTLAVRDSQDWVALVVYVAVTLVVGRIVARLRAARGEARRREDDTRRLFELSDVLIAESSLHDLLELIVDTAQRSFELRSVAILLPSTSGFSVVAAAGNPFDESELRTVAPAGGEVRSVPSASIPGALVGIPLSAAGRPVGLLAVAGASLSGHDWGLLRTYANQAAIAIERSQLREKVLRGELLEAVDRWRGALMGAVSHDLRTPLASIKAAVSDLRRSDVDLSATDSAELLELVEVQSDRLARLVTNLLDMTRIESGALTLQREVLSLDELVGDALTSLTGTIVAGRVHVTLSPELPLVEADSVLIGEVLANLLENADRYAPVGSVIEVHAVASDDQVEVFVTDHGPGIADEERERIFGTPHRVGGAGRTGLGLTIAKAFVEAHGQSIRVEHANGGGARFGFTLAVAALPNEGWS